MTPLPAAPAALVVVPDHRRSSLDLLPDPPPRSPTCAAPVCPEPPVNRHHIIARGSTFGPADWVFVDGELFSNVADLCFRHHDALESGWGGCKSRIRWVGKVEWGWYDRGTEPTPTGVWWYDSKTNTWWQFKGFLRGGVERWVPWKNIPTTS